MALRTIPVRRAGNRHNLFLGGDRELVMTAGLLAFTLVHEQARLVIAERRAVVRSAAQA